MSLVRFWQLGTFVTCQTFSLSCLSASLQFTANNGKQPKKYFLKRSTLLSCNSCLSELWIRLGADTHINKLTSESWTILLKMSPLVGNCNGHFHYCSDETINQLMQYELQYEYKYAPNLFYWEVLSKASVTQIHWTAWGQPWFSVFCPKSLQHVTGGVGNQSTNPMTGWQPAPPP